MRAHYRQLSRFCPTGRTLREQFDDDPEPGKHQLQTAAYFRHVNDCLICRRARAQLLAEHLAPPKR